MKDQYLEINEAYAAGERALESLYAAQDYLRSAGNWGIFDMLGGGFISTMAKRSKMRDANACMEQAQYDLQRFQQELRDVTSIPGLYLEMDGFLGFADYFFDGLLADLLVQSRIREAQAKVDAAIEQVHLALARLDEAR